MNFFQVREKTRGKKNGRTDQVQCRNCPESVGPGVILPSSTGWAANGPIIADATFGGSRATASSNHRRGSSGAAVGGWEIYCYYLYVAEHEHRRNRVLCRVEGIDSILVRPSTSLIGCSGVAICPGPIAVRGKLF